MKKHILKTLTLIAFILMAGGAFAQVPPPPPSGHGAGGNQEAGGGGAPIGSGIGILLALGAAYGGKKVYTAYKELGDRG